MELALTSSLYGKFHIGDSTEIKLEIASSQATSANLSIDDLNGVTLRHLQIDEQEKKTLWLPVTPKDNGELLIRLRPESGDPIVRSLTLSSTDLPITLVSIEPRQHEWRQSEGNQTDTTAILLISATGFPHTPQGYAAVQSIVTDLQTLSALDVQQSRALGSFLRACGILLLDDPPPAVVTRLAAQAGCGGRFITGFRRLGEVPALLEQLTGQLPPRLPDITDLRKLDQTTGQLSILFYLSVYLLCMALLSGFTKRPAILILFPLLTAGAGLFAWYGKGQQHLIVWAEKEAGDAHARYSAMLRAGGDRRGLQSTICSLESRLNRGPHEFQEDLPISQDEDAGARRIPSESALFSPEVLRLEGLLQSSQTLALDLSFVEAQPRVSNLSRIPSPPGHLVWQNRSYRIPILKPEQIWFPDIPEDALNEPAERLLSRRLAYDEAALLYPLTMDYRLIAPSTTRADGWLVIHPARGRG